MLRLELAVDRAAFDTALRAGRGRGEDREILRRYVRRRIDARNAATLLALAGTRPAADAFVAGGRSLAASDFERLAGGPPVAVRARLAAVFGCAEAALATPWSADRAIEEAGLRPLHREARLRPLSLAVPLAYLAERRAEIRRVALLLRGAALGLPGDEILDLVEA
jgi:V/A-type H+-transporting ATPase subunit C